MRKWLSPIASIVIRELRAKHIENRDFSGLKFQGEFYEKAALMRHRYGAARNDPGILQSCRDALKMYHAALSAYEKQSLVQIPGFADYLKERQMIVKDITEPFSHLPELSGRVDAAEPVLAGR